MIYDIYLVLLCSCTEQFSLVRGADQKFCFDAAVLLYIEKSSLISDILL